MAAVRFEVICCWDDDAQLWYVHDSNVPGLSAEAPTQEEMGEILKALVPKLAILNSSPRPSDGVPIELLFNPRKKVLSVHY